MADEQIESVATDEPNGIEEVDYKAKYEDVLKHSREWEKRAKANKAAADELAKLKESQLSETEKLQKQLAEYKAKADALQADKDRAAWVKDASAKTGVPAELLSLISATDSDDLMAKAESLSEKYGKAEESAPTVPVMLGDGKHADHTPTGNAKSDFAAFMKAFN